MAQHCWLASFDCDSPTRHKTLTALFPCPFSAAKRTRILLAQFFPTDEKIRSFTQFVHYSFLSSQPGRENSSLVVFPWQPYATFYCPSLCCAVFRKFCFIISCFIHTGTTSSPSSLYRCVGCGGGFEYTGVVPCFHREGFFASILTRLSMLHHRKAVRALRALSSHMSPT